jgi:hypothetical protein
MFHVVLQMVFKKINSCSNHKTLLLNPQDASTLLASTSITMVGMYYRQRLIEKSPCGSDGKTIAFVGSILRLRDPGRITW